MSFTYEIKVVSAEQFDVYVNGVFKITQYSMAHALAYISWLYG